jgi:hypothetical protein
MNTAVKVTEAIMSAIDALRPTRMPPGQRESRPFPARPAHEQKFVAGPFGAAIQR